MEPVEFAGEGIDTRVVVYRLPDAPFPREVKFAWSDIDPLSGVLAYFVRVMQENGSRAYSSPFYVISTTGK